MSDERPPPWRIVSEPPDTGDRWGIWPLVGAIAVIAAVAVIVIGVFA